VAPRVCRARVCWAGVGRQCITHGPAPEQPQRLLAEQLACLLHAPGADAPHDQRGRLACIGMRSQLFTDTVHDNFTMTTEQMRWATHGVKVFRVTQLSHLTHSGLLSLFNS
jgi:hypothetical protein